MTEAEWLHGDQLLPMLDVVVAGYLRRHVRSWFFGDRQRKLRLFLCACWRVEGAGGYEPLVEVAARYADGVATRADLADARQQALDMWLRWRPWWRYGLYEPYARVVLSPATLSAQGVYRLAASGYIRLLGLEQRSVRLLREVYHPFRDPRVRPYWNTPLVRGLAEGIVEDQAYDRMGILADALEDGGCDDAFLMAHCRDGGRHFRGCWALDYLLGRE